MTTDMGVPRPSNAISKPVRHKKEMSGLLSQSEELVDWLEDCCECIGSQLTRASLGKVQLRFA